METGENPVRYRHCEEGVLSIMSLGDSMMISEPGYMHETCDCSNGILHSGQKSESVNTD